MAADGTFLSPIDKPGSLAMKFFFALSRKLFGKVMMPMRVHTARLPLDFLKFYMKTYQLDKKLQISSELISLIRQRVARVNGCHFCMDSGRFAALKASISEAKLDALSQYGTSALFTDAERSALDYATELTRDKHVDPDTFSRLAKYYSERELCEIAYVVASEHLSNITNIGMNVGSDGFCSIT